MTNFLFVIIYIQIYFLHGYPNILKIHYSLQNSYFLKLFKSIDVIFHLHVVLHTFNNQQIIKRSYCWKMILFYLTFFKIDRSPKFGMYKVYTGPRTPIWNNCISIIMPQDIVFIIIIFILYINILYTNILYILSLYTLLLWNLILDKWYFVN